jgi:TRAP transporter TAXI family solute receptor
LKTKRISKILVGIGLVVVLAIALPLVSACAPAEETPTPAEWKPPRAVQWISCGTASTGFASGSALVGILGELTGVTFRILPGAKTADRAIPLYDGSCSIGIMTGADTFSALEGMLEFEDLGLGPQSWRSVYAGGTIAQGMMTRGDSGVETSADVKGCNYARFPTYPSVQIFYMTAYLAYCDLTWDDVNPIDVGGYADGLNAVIQGKADITFASATAGLAEELCASIHGLHWMPMPAEETEAWARFHEVNAFFYPWTETVCACCSEENPAVFWGWDYGVRCYDWTDPDLVYWTTSLLHKHYDDYKDAHAFLRKWHLEHQLNYANWFCPWHEGAVQYWKDQGLWTDEMEAKQQEMLANYPQKTAPPW